MKYVYFLLKNKFETTIRINKKPAFIGRFYSYLSFLLIFPSAIIAQQWEDVTPGEYEILIGDFINENQGWIFKGGEILYTDDGTQTFNPIYFLPQEYEGLIKLDMVDEFHGFGTAYYENTYYFLRTDDGAYSWENITDTTLMFNGPLKWSTGYYFIDKDIGFYGGQNCIYKTDDAGDNWTEMITPQPGIDPLLLGDSYGINQINFYNNNYGWAICSWYLDAGLAMKTTNGGNLWEICEIALGYPDMWDIHYTDSLSCGITSYGMGKAVIITEDNFLSLTYVHYDWPQANYTICYQNDSTIWVSGIPSILSRSTNSGESFDIFQEVELPGISSPGINDIQFYSNSGYAIGNKFLLKFQDTTTVFYNPNLNFQNELDVWPVPVKDNLNFSFNSKYNDDIQIIFYSTVNNEVEFLTHKQVFNGENIMQINLEMLKNGLYIFIIRSNGNNFVRKIIKN